jgi:hypothetical protein
MLRSKEELDFVLRRMEEYPAGVNPRSWFCGRYEQKENRESDYYSMCGIDACLEYG